jgi:hypothetical protein
MSVNALRPVEALMHKTCRGLPPGKKPPVLWNRKISESQRGSRIFRGEKNTFSLPALEPLLY